jgi:DNA polymerase-3 subunit gamma/tau
MYVVFARKYRPQRFGEVIGQEHIARTLQNAVKADRVAQAYLFCGSRGVGKTTMARILAKALNCEQGPTPEPCGKCEACRRIATGDDLDVMEIDGASNRGIDEVRALRQNVRLAPAHSRFKIYYVDEVHMLTEPAFNALLKTLEEPPAHVKFIFSTTDPLKLPETVRSRCQRFDFRRIPDAGIVQLLDGVCRKEGLELEPGAASVIARAARGSMRDALGALDQLGALSGKIRMEDVLAVLGAVDRLMLGQIVDALAQEDAPAALRATHRVLFGGTDAEDFADQLSEYLRDLLVASYCGADDPMLAGAMADAETLKRQSQLFTPDQFSYMIVLLREAKLRARRDTTGRIAIELAILKMCRLSDLVPIQEALEELSGGPGPARGADRPPASGAAAAEAGQGPVGRIRNIKERLKSGRKADPLATAERKVPEGMDEVKYRQVAAAAESPEVGREALKKEALLKAFGDADKALGLSPQRLERLQRREKAEEPEAEAEAGEEQAE